MQKRRKNLEKRQNHAIEEKRKLLKNIETTDALKLSPEKYHADRLVLFDKVNLGFGERRLLDKLSFEICTGDRIALCGKNGCGKTTVIRMILNALSNQANAHDFGYEGSFHVGSGLKVSYISQPVSYTHLAKYTAAVSERTVSVRTGKTTVNGKLIDFTAKVFFEMKI